MGDVPAHVAVGEPAVEALFVDPGVVVAAEQGGVVQVGGSAVGPVDQVVRLFVSACPIERNLAMTTTFPPEFVAAVYALGNDIDAFKVKQSTRNAGIGGLRARLEALQAEVESLEGIEVAAGRGQDEPTHRPEPDVPGYCTYGTLTKLCEGQR